MDTENTVRYPDVKIRNTFRYLAARKIKQITEINTHNILHERHDYSLTQIKILQEQNNLMTANTGKGRTMVIIHKDALKQKISTFLQENRITALDKDPTDYFQKHIHQISHKCNIMKDKNQYKHLLQIKPTALKLSAMIKIQNDNNPIGLEINNIQEPAYKLARYLNKRLNEVMEVPYTYTTKKT